MMILEGMPLVLLELAAGQRFRQGAYGVWNMIHPWLGGIGVGSTVIAVVVGCYYNMIIAWCVYYLINSFWVRPLSFFKKNCTNPALFFYFGLFFATISIIQIEKIVDGVLGIQTQGRRRQNRGS